ncbi:hypothetical protein C9374_004553 [Naegleria lovaniensis]|uniref:ditrans,polycis-polyprenyl diphosphate synthase [(2E,6E)-farnesyldiphosphate specific] n=1 Tax=Naegleria lovaniensis TaxID=51637 RepID=A0AA88GQ38_NAELO|nr:uncharacterized protein C9374_004553 [Naegleria lovaniensis]KAG2383216.1 hypothetical protein C9374_004553 [Naegleria lovaniensis]
MSSKPKDILTSLSPTLLSHNNERKNSEYGLIGAFRSCSHFLIHSLYLLLYSCYLIYHHVWKRISQMMMMMMVGTSDHPSSLTHLFNQDTTISKFPNHLAIAIDTEMLSPHILHTNSHIATRLDKLSSLDGLVMKQIQNIIYWSLTTFSNLNNHSIQSIAFYDKHGILEQHSKQIFDFVERALIQSSDEFTINQNIKIVEVRQVENEIPYLKISTTRNISHIQSLTVRLLSFQNSGKPSITKLANSIYEELKHHEQDLEHFNELVRHKVNETLHRHIKENIPEPNILISFSNPVLILHGFSPLHLKYTQIAHVEKCFVKQFTETDFVKCIFEYISCNQRFGK